jgi:hypothetical protein
MDFDPISKATIGMEGVQSTLNDHTKELAKIAQKRIKVSFHTKDEQNKTLSEIQKRVEAMDLEAKMLRDLASVFTSYCDDMSKVINESQKIELF